MYNFTYHRASGLRQATNMLGKFEEAKLLAGGQTLLPTMKLRLASPTHIIDLNKIEGISDIEMKGRNIVIGALARHADVANSPVVKQAIPALAELAGMIGDPAVRHRGTIGGSIANNDPNADYPAACLALGATITTTKRKIVADEFFKGLFETALEPDEIVTKVTLPDPEEGGLPEVPQPGVAFRPGRRVRRQAALRSARRGDGRRRLRRVPGDRVRGGAEEAVLAEVARGDVDPRRRPCERHPRQRRIPRPSRRRAGPPRGGCALA